MEDLIRRSDAIKAIEALECFGYIECKTKGLVKDINAIPSADRPSESIGKLIERMEEYRDKQLLMSDYWYGINWAINTIRVSDIADRPQGKWIRRDYWSEGVGMGESYGFYYECSNCGEQQKGGYGNCGMKYCPDCGARMKGVGDEQ